MVGQQHITRTLKNAIAQNRLAHAYIFVGPRGTGKTSTARIFAKALNCQRAPTIEPCGECDSCREIAEGRSLDVLEFDAASNTQVEKIREIIIDNVKYSPTNGRFKLYIVDEVHMLSNSSFNALLKTLEEPPEHVKFVFATTDVQKVPTTILSRCQRFDLRRIPAAEIAAHLHYIAGKEGIAMSALAADAIARGAEGGLRDAESMLDQLVAFCGQNIDESDVLDVFGFTSTQTVFDLCQSLIAHDVSSGLAVVNRQAAAGRDLMRLLGDLIAHLRNLLVLKADPSAMEEEFGAEFAAALAAQGAYLPMDKLLDLIEQLAATEGRMKWAANKKMHLEIAVIRAVQTLAQANLSEVIDVLHAIKVGGEIPPRALPPVAPAPVISRPVAKAAYHVEMPTLAPTAPAPATPVKEVAPVRPVTKGFPEKVTAPASTTLDTEAKAPQPPIPPVEAIREPAKEASPPPPTPESAVHNAPSAILVSAVTKEAVSEPVEATLEIAPVISEAPPVTKKRATRSRAADEATAPAKSRPARSAALSQELESFSEISPFSGASDDEAPFDLLPPSPPAKRVELPDEPVHAAPAAVVEPPVLARSTESLDDSGVSELWILLVNHVRTTRPLIAMWVEAGVLVEIIKDSALLCFAPDQMLALEAVERQHRKFLEETFSELRGRPTTLRIEKRAGIEVVNVPRPEPKPERSTMELFRDDDVIKKALEEFRGELQSL